MCLWIGICVGLSLVFYHHFFPSVLAFPTFPFFYRYARLQDKKKKNRKKRIQLRDSLQILEGCLQAGSSIEKAMAQTERELCLLYGDKNEMAGYFQKMNVGISINRSAEEMWREFAKESELEEVETFSKIFDLVRRRGGALSQVSTHVVNQITMSIQTEEEILTMIQGKKTEMQIMNLIPIFILLYMSFFGSDMIAVMYEEWIGRIIMTFCLGIYIGAWLLGMHLVDISV